MTLLLEGLAAVYSPQNGYPEMGWNDGRLSGSGGDDGGNCVFDSALTQAQAKSTCNGTHGLGGLRKSYDVRNTAISTPSYTILIPSICAICTA